jgi:hypothetical protein
MAETVSQGEVQRFTVMEAQKHQPRREGHPHHPEGEAYKGVREEELRGGSQRRSVSAVRAEVASSLGQEGGITFAEIARQVGVCTTAMIRAVQRWERVAERL